MHHSQLLFLFTPFLLSLVAGCGGGGSSSTPPAASAFTVSVSVSGLGASQRIEFALNESEAQPITGSGSVAFTKRFSNAETWSIAIQRIPVATLCTISPERGTIANASVTVSVNCSTPAQKLEFLKDVNEQSTDHSSNPQHFIAAGNRVVFTANRDPDNLRLFSTGGSPNDVVAIVNEDLRFPMATSALPGKLLYRHDVGSSNLTQPQLSAYDTTSGRSERIASIEPAFGTTIGNQAVFFARDVDERFGFEPWISDGTPQGTRLIKDIFAGSRGSSQVYTILSYNGRWFFVADSGSGSQLWSTDGTEAGTIPVSPTNRLVSSLLGTHEGRIFYVAKDAGANRTAVWSSDGRTNDELMVQALSEDGTGNAYCFLSTPTGFYYIASSFEPNGIGNFLWHSTSATAGPIKIVGTGNAAGAGGALIGVSLDTCGLTSFNGRVWFAGEDANRERQLWVTDGTGAGTRAVVNGVVALNVQSQFFLPVLQDKLIFPRMTPEHGRELWWTDGTRVELLADIVPGSGSGINGNQNLAGIVHQGKLYFTAETPDSGAEPWVTDGTSVGTRQLGNIVAETRTLDGVQTLLGRTSAGVFFSGCSTAENCELWVTDGSPEGTRMVIDLDPARGTNPRLGFVHADRLYFRNDQFGLWQSDGTATGTKLLARIATYEFHSAGNVLLFSGEGSGGNEGIELWRTDGTEAGTYLLADVAPGVTSSRPGHFVSSGNWVYYRAVGVDRAIGLWRTDPVSGATERVLAKDITELDQDERLAEIGDTLLFPATDAEAGAELWRVSGFNASRIADINPGAAGSFPHNMTRFRDELFFRARDASTFGLWASDGNTVRKVFDVRRDERDDPGNMRVVNGKLYMNASAPIDDSLLHVLDSPSTSPRSLHPPGDSVIGARHFSALDDTWLSFIASTTSGWAVFATDGTQVVQLNDTVTVSTEPPIAVPSGTARGVWFVGSDAAKGRELWRVR